MTLTPSDPPIETDVLRVKEMRDQQVDFLLLDCREDNEVAICSIDGSLHIPMNETPNRVSELTEFTEKGLVVY